MKQRAVIFDMDGVISHTNPYHTKAFEIFFAKRNVFPTQDEFAKHMFGKSNAYILTHFLGREFSGQEFIDLEFEKESLFRQIYADHVAPIKGYLEFLEDLKANDFKTGVATSAPLANLDLIASTFGIYPKMESIMASEDVINHKPDPEVYLKSAANLDMKNTECVVFEDSFSGISAAINAKMKVVGVLSSHKIDELPKCDLYINDYTEINAKTIINLLGQ